jgi:diguanylate cyclase (GGDEF)-like protein/PAS domain S-box-containing protein
MEENPFPEVTEARFQKLFDDAEAMSIQGYLPDGTVVYWNHASELIYGYSRDEALDRNLFDLIIPPEMREAALEGVRWMFENRRGIPTSRLDLLHKDGRRVPVYSSHTVVSVPGVSPVLFCLDADMSALAQAESELRIAAVAFDSQQGIAITDANGVILRVNRAFTEATGYSAEEARGQTLELIRSARHPHDFYSTLWQRLLLTNHWQGEVWNQRKDGEIYADWLAISGVTGPDGQVNHYVVMHTDLTERKEAEAKITQLAFFDPVTRLPNRRWLLARLRQAVSAVRHHQNAGALLLIDLDHFKTLNDTLGHDIGDQLLYEIGERLSSCLRDGDCAGRLGGDEFVVILEDLGRHTEEAAPRAEAVARKILHGLSQPWRLSVHEFTGSASIGITLFTSPDDRLDELMKQADLAMYEAKSAGRNTLCFFDPEMQEAVTRRAALLRGLRQALRTNQLRLLYQPQVDRHGCLIGVEALVRWDAPGRGLISPAEFIPAAEESGMIVTLGHQVLQTACQQLVQWARQPDTAAWTMAVNVSAVQFNFVDFVDQVFGILDNTGADARRLKLELTESLLVNHLDDMIAKMSRLKSRGIGFALDDFGTGYSSLSYLHRLPLDQLKIDKSFVHNLPEDPHSTAIAETIIVLGRTMGLSVLAEGVETEAQRDLLTRLGCETFQGYLFGRPQTAEALTGG